MKNVNPHQVYPSPAIALKYMLWMVAALLLATVPQANAQLYTEDFTTDPGFAGTSSVVIGSTASTVQFGQYGGTVNGATASTSSGAFSVAMASGGTSARSRAWLVAIDTSAAAPGAYSIDFDVSNWDASGDPGNIVYLRVYNGGGLDWTSATTGYITANCSANNNSTRPTFTQTGATVSGAIATTSFQADGHVNVLFTLANAGNPGDFLLLTWNGIRNATTVAGPTFSVDNVNVSASLVVATNLLLTSSETVPRYNLTPIQYTAVLKTNNVTAEDAAGNITFYYSNMQTSATAPFSTNAVIGGSATSLLITNLPRGTNLITAIYSGDSNYLPLTNTLTSIVLNHPPIANVMRVSQDINGVNIALSDLATNWYDRDSDPVSLVSVASLSANGIELIANNWITNLDGTIATTNADAYIGYTNSLGGNDRISYSIADGQGGTNIGFVDIIVPGSAMTLVQWSTLDGSVDISDWQSGTYADGPAPPTTYNTINPVQSSSTSSEYYPWGVPTDQNPIYYTALSVSGGYNQVRLGPILQVGKSVATDTFLQGMVVWRSENGFQTVGTIDTFSIVMNMRKSSTGTLRWLVEEGGQFYISDGIAMAQFNTTVVQAAASVGWYYFTPLSSGAYAIGDAATPTFNNDTSVGYFFDLANVSGGSQQCAAVVSYFNVTAVPNGMKASALALTSSAPTNDYLAPITFTATVQTNNVVASDASGSVTFYYQLTGMTAVPFSTNTIVSGGTVTSLSITNLPVGSSLITAIYSGDSVYTSSSKSLNQVINSLVPAATNITYSVNGNELVLAWPDGQGWRLEVQTNGPGTGLSTNWSTVIGATPPLTNNVNPAAGSVFYRLRFP